MNDAVWVSLASGVEIAEVCSYVDMKGICTTSGTPVILAQGIRDLFRL